MNERQILHKMNEYVAGKLTARKLESWTVRNLQKTLDSDSEPARALLNEIDSLLIELGQGIIDENDFVNSLIVMTHDSQHSAEFEDRARHDMDYSSPSISKSFTGSDVQFQEYFPASV